MGAGWCGWPANWSDADQLAARTIGRLSGQRDSQRAGRPLDCLGWLAGCPASRLGGWSSAWPARWLGAGPSPGSLWGGCRAPRPGVRGGSAGGARRIREPQQRRRGIQFSGTIARTIQVFRREKVYSAWWVVRIHLFAQALHVNGSRRPGPLTSHPWSPPRFHESANHYTLSLPSDPPGHSWRGALATAPSTSDRRQLRAPALGVGTQLLALASSSRAQRQTLALALGAALKALGASSWRRCPAKGWRLARVFAAGSWRWRLASSQSWRPALAPSDCAL